MKPPCIFDREDLRFELFNCAIEVALKHSDIANWGNRISVKNSRNYD